ncbi:MAG: hypothetical protein LC798_11325 [Chloroflexi bacterium]|nr:hypothetical protein [Chloroflexota bacterium]
MGHGHAHARPAWGEAPPGLWRRLLARARSTFDGERAATRSTLRELPLVLRRGELAGPYLDAERTGDHRRAGAAAAAAMDRSLAGADWWPADAWGHRALWHFEQAGLTLQATRQARRIGDLRSAAGDPESARRYYAEAIDEARDIGAEHEQGLAALGLGEALLQLGEVTNARRLAGASETLLDRAGAPAGEIARARRLRGSEVRVESTETEEHR